MKQRTDHLINIFSSGYLTTDKEGKIIFANKYLLNLFGVEEAELAGQRFLQDFFPDSTKAYFETTVIPLLHRQGSVEEIGIELIRSDGSFLPVSLSASLEKDNREEIKTIYYNFVDSAWSQKQALELFKAAERQDLLLQQLQESNAQIEKDNAYYKSIIENQSFYIIKTDIHGNYTYMNPYFCTILGIKAEEWIGKNALGLIIPEDQDVCVQTIKRCFADPDQTQWVILRKEALAGRISTQWEFSLLRDEHSNLSEVLCIGHNITPLMKKQEELQQVIDITAGQNKRLLDFTYIVSHNIRSHVANLSGMIDTIDMDDEQDRNYTLGMLKKSVAALDDTIHNLNEIISIQANTNLPEREMNIWEEVQKVLVIIQTNIIASNATVELNFSNNEKICTNPAYLESILLNLLINAIKYKSYDHDPLISISLTKDASYLILAVRDNGLGIDLKKYRDRLFGMYNTFHGNKDAKGLGLFIIKTQIETLNGKIEAESEPGKGSTFKVYFPLEKLKDSQPN